MIKKIFTRTNQMSSVSKNTKFDAANLQKLKKKELEEMCIKRGLYAKGVKQELIKRLLKKECSLFLKNTNYNLYYFSQNYYVYSNLNFVFNKNTNAVIGKLNEKNEIVYLTKNDLITCKKYKFIYEIPPVLEGENMKKKNKKLEDEIFSDDEYE